MEINLFIEILKYDKEKNGSQCCKEHQQTHYWVYLARDNYRVVHTTQVVWPTSESYY